MKTIKLSSTGKGFYTKNGAIKGYFELPKGEHQIQDGYELFELAEGEPLPPVVSDVPAADPEEKLINAKAAEILRAQAIDALITEGKLSANTPKKGKPVDKK